MGLGPEAFSTFRPSDDFLAGQSLAEFCDQSTGSPVIDKASKEAESDDIEEEWQDLGPSKLSDVVGVALALVLLGTGRVLGVRDLIRERIRGKATNLSVTLSDYPEERT